MLSIIEKVLILKRIDIFTSTPDPILAEVAELLEEIELPTAFKLFEKGESGRCMYMVVDGHIRIHNDGHTLTDVGPGEVFGEMALLDSAPRVASAMAVEDTLLLKLDQGSRALFTDYELFVACCICR